MNGFEPKVLSRVDRSVSQQRRLFSIYLLVKRLHDIVFALSGLVLFLPLLLIVPIMIKLDSPGPVIFRQERVGKDGRPFTIYKFRTMFVDTPDVAKELLMRSNLNAVTRVGRWLRRTSLDELPQFLNILKGDMSLVGPRPALYNQYDLIQLRKSLGVDRLKPGLTGYAQVLGRGDLSLKEKVRLDHLYLERMSFFLDFKILLLTVVTLLTRKGAY